MRNIKGNASAFARCEWTFNRYADEMTSDSYLGATSTSFYVDPNLSKVIPVGTLLLEKEHWSSHTKSKCCTYYTTVLTYREAGVVVGGAASSPGALRGYTDHLAPLYFL